MPPYRSRPQSSPTLLGGTIVICALAAGVAMFALVASFVGPIRGAAADPSVEGADVGQMLTPIAIGYTLVAAALALFLRGVLLRRAIQDPRATLEALEGGHLTNELMGAALMPAAIAESAGLLGCVVLMLSGDSRLLAIPAASIAIVLLFVPSKRRLVELVESAPRNE